jgi:HNH endonuclease
MYFGQREIYDDDRGYYRFRDNNQLVHRWVVEQHIGHKIPGNCVVHHINHDKHDNRYENLILATWNAHSEVHIQESKIKYNKQTQKGCLLIAAAGAGLILLLIIINIISHIL